jgi:cytochrome c oxidase subunit 2
MSHRIRAGVAAASAALAVALGAASTASAGTGQPSPGQIGLQNPVTPVAEAINAFHDFTNIIIIAITAFVLALLVYVILRFNERANPTPSRFTHNTTVEVIWTVVPVLILIAIAVPSFRLLFLQYSYPKPDITVKAIGNAWFWDHEYPDLGVKVTSNILRDEDVLKADLGDAEFNKRYGSLPEGLERMRVLQRDAAPVWQKRGDPRLLAVDNEIAVPVNAVVHVLVTASDVIHNWTIPSFGSKVDAVPGRVNATWFKATKVGAYYGQCSELCGRDHAFMPIAVRVVSQADFDAWVAAVKARDRNKARQILRTATGAPPLDNRVAMTSN